MLHGKAIVAALAALLSSFRSGFELVDRRRMGPCLVQVEPSGQASANKEEHDCPTFFAGSLLLYQRGFEWIKHDDNDKAVVAAFTIVLALSTIGLWLATNKLWEAGERQLARQD